jgi:hypothetical protein
MSTYRVASGPISALFTIWLVLKLTESFGWVALVIIFLVMAFNAFLWWKAN